MNFCSLLIVHCSLFIVNCVFAQNNCLQEVKDIYSGMQAFTTKLPDKGKVNYFKYTVTTTVEDSTQMATIEAWMTNNQSFVQTKDLIYYQDEKYSYTIIPSEKSIYKQLPQSAETNKMLQLQDSLFDQVTVLSCEEKNYDQKKLKEVVLHPEKYLKKKYHLNNLVIYIDLAEKKVQRIVQEFDSNSKNIKSIDIRFEVVLIDARLKEQTFVKSSSNTKEILAEYKNYHIVDNIKL